jgi:uncharacterized protein (TIGR02246 family)
MILGRSCVCLRDRTIEEAVMSQPTTRPTRSAVDAEQPDEQSGEVDRAEAEAEVRALVERWAEAVQVGDLEAVLADHADDIVMFDVPPPEQGVRGLDAYRDSWPGFFAWIRAGATFEVVELEVTAGREVAYAWALLRCGDEAQLAADPEHRLRLSLGLRREWGRWIVAHEHHSFVDRT